MNVNWVNSIKTNGEPSKTPFVEEKQNSVEYIVERTGFEQENNNKIIEEFRKNEIKKQRIQTTYFEFYLLLTYVSNDTHNSYCFYSNYKLGCWKQSFVVHL